jgi:hypothetical protein
MTTRMLREMNTVTSPEQSRDDSRSPRADPWGAAFDFAAGLIPAAMWMQPGADLANTGTGQRGTTARSGNPGY